MERPGEPRLGINLAEKVGQLKSQVRRFESTLKLRKYERMEGKFDLLTAA